MSRSSSAGRGGGAAGGGSRTDAPPRDAAEQAGAAGAPELARTLYRADLSDPRQRAAQPREVVRGRAARRAESTSDVTRFRGVLPATLAGAVATGAAALLFPPPGGHAAPGPLSLPHARAGLTCASCHAEPAPGAAQGTSAARRPGATTDGATTDDAATDDAATDGATTGARALDQACTGCHGAHGTIRRSHAQLLARGALACATCHPIHRADQGVVFDPARPPVRFAPGVEVELPATAFRPSRPATVAIVTAGSCAPCHDLAAPRDPIARCLASTQAPLGDARPITCFDEHRPALPEDAPAARGGAPGAGDGGVCRGQHTEDRALAWDAARDAAAVLPVVTGAAAGGAARAALDRRALLWLGAGVAAAAAALAGARGGHALRARRARRAAPPAADLMLRASMGARVRLPVIDTTTCLGCYACVDACPYDVLAVERYVAVVARPEACCGLTLCEQRCPNGSLTIEGGAGGAPIEGRPRLGDDLESLDVPGLYLAGDITGLPLIKNAIHQGAHAATRIAEDLRKAGPGGPGLDLIIVGAGPAGISAALRAKELGLSFEVIEQGSVAQSIQSFPRGKLVFDQPLDLPVTGKLWLKESTKEELLSHWLRVVRKERLPIVQDTRMLSIARAAGAATGARAAGTDVGGADAGARGADAGARGAAEASAGFVVTTAPRDGGATGAPTERRARRVLLAIGQRGSPRRLPFELPAEVEGRVYYHLADARSLAGSRVLVVGLGDVAMEAAIALARQPDTAVAIAYRGGGFRRGKTRNIEEIRRLAAASRLSLLLETEVTALAADPRGGLAATLSSPAGARVHPCDAVLVLVGSIPPWSALRAAGIQPTAAPTDRPRAEDVEGSTPAGPPP
ncbi:NAD(P)-binding domain-containing protein [Sorangium sp. So ce131]|uniref:NAD(P)-binding domain-containing protein n=1 Tax=Sorangium sp. So ce131 TaxID=3133282 RepID=UPI003F629892